MVIVIVLALSLVGLAVKNKFFSKPGPGALQISTTPRATVLIDGNQVGTTPFFDDKIQPGEHTVKLIPEATTDGLIGWEGKVTLASGLLTAINRNFGTSDALSSGEIIWLEKIASRDKSSLSVISIPDQAVVKVDGEPKGFATVTVEDLNPGSHQVVVTSTGFEEKTVSSAKTVAGFKLIVKVQLAQKIEGIQGATESAEMTTPTPEVKGKTATPTPTPTKAKTTPTVEPEKPYVRIKDTPTGWLRVRVEPSVSATEAAKVNPGETFPYLDEEKGGWYKIEYEKGKEGWISGVYVELVK